MPPTPSILAVVVLYCETPQQSRAVRAFAACFTADPALAQIFSLLLYDNSPEPPAAAPPLPFPHEYIHDPRNLGLPAAYNYALRRAREQNTDWLLLLDQDTEVTPAYLAEAHVLTAEHAADEHIAAFAPKLLSAKGLKSPTLDFLEWLRRQVQFPRKRPLFASPDAYGPQEEELTAFNSASILRVAALERIGGFPEEFWLDFLDIAVFHALYQAGGRLFVMHARLQHELSMDTRGFYERGSALDRHRNLLDAMVRFVRLHGTARDCRLNRLWLLRNALSLLRNAKNKRFAWESLKQAVLYRATAAGEASRRPRSRPL